MSEPCGGQVWGHLAPIAHMVRGAVLRGVPQHRYRHGVGSLRDGARPLCSASPPLSGRDWFRGGGGPAERQVAVNAYANPGPAPFSPRGPSSDFSR